MRNGFRSILSVFLCPTAFSGDLVLSADALSSAVDRPVCAATNPTSAAATATQPSNVFLLVMTHLLYVDRVQLGPSPTKDDSPSAWTWTSMSGYRRADSIPSLWRRPEPTCSGRMQENALDRITSSAARSSPRCAQFDR